MDYVIREGIVLEEICGRYLLISTLAARDKCTYVKTVEPIVAYYWSMMEEGLSIDEMTKTAAKQFPEISDDVLRQDIQDLIIQLKEKGYLLGDDEL